MHFQTFFSLMSTFSTPTLTIYKKIIITIEYDDDDDNICIAQMHSQSVYIKHTSLYNVLLGLYVYSTPYKKQCDLQIIINLYCIYVRLTYVCGVYIKKSRYITRVYKTFILCEHLLTIWVHCMQCGVALS